MSLSKKDTENILFDLVDQIARATRSAKSGYDRGQLVMRFISHNTDPKIDSDDVSLGNLMVMCDFVISAMQLGYFDEIYEKMVCNEKDYIKAIEDMCSGVMGSRVQAR